MDITHTTFELLPHSRVRLSFTVSKEEVGRRYRDKVRHYAKRAKIRGFRAGKAPESMILSRFEGDIRDSALQETISEAVSVAIKGQDSYRLLPHDPPRLVRKPDFDPERNLSAEVEFDVLPDVALPSYEGRRITIPEMKVGNGDVQRELQQLRQRRAVYHERKVSEAVRVGDAVVIDVAEAGDGAGAGGGEGAVGADTERRFIIGGDDAPPYAKELVGLRVGQSKRIPADRVADTAGGAGAGVVAPTAGAGAAGAGAGAANASGAAASGVAGAADIAYRAVTIRSAKYPVPPKLDDAFARGVNEKFATMSDLKKAIRAELEAHYARRLKQIRQDRLVKDIIARLTINLPFSMIEAEKEIMWRQLQSQYRATEEQLTQIAERGGTSKAQLFQEWNEQAVYRAKEVLVIRELQKTEKIDLTERHVNAFIADRAAQSGHDAEALKKLYIERDQMDGVVQECALSLLFARLFEKTTFVVDKKLKID